MNKNVKVGVFLCECGANIKPFIDLKKLKSLISLENNISCEILPYSCLKPGTDLIYNKIAKQGLNRIIIGGCEGRLISYKFEKALTKLDLFEEQIDIVNLRGHISSCNEISKKDATTKALILIKAAIAEMEVLRPTPNEKIYMNQPIIILGDGLACWIVAKTLEEQEINYFMMEETIKIDCIETNLELKYPGSMVFKNKFEQIRKKILNGKFLKIIPKSKLTSMSGVTGNYELVFINEKGAHSIYNASNIIYCSDCNLTESKICYDYNKKNIITQNRLHYSLSKYGLPKKGNIVFWIDDYERRFPEFAKLSCKSALRISQELNVYAKVSILYNELISKYLTPEDLILARKLDISLIPYSNGYSPVIKHNTINSVYIKNGIENEIKWDFIVTSPKRIVSKKQIEIANILGIVKTQKGLLDIHNPPVRPRQKGKSGIYLIGSSQRPLELNEIITNAYKISREITITIKESKEKGLRVPRIVCTIDKDKCSGCGLAKNICENSCFTIPGSGIVSKADPMLCTGGGTCTAACPYGALDLKNSTTKQREARISSLSKQIKPSDFIVVGCNWGGLSCIDNAGKQKLNYTSAAYVMSSPCIGQLDIRVMSKAFLEGSSGLLLMGCYPGQCHHSYGIDHAWSRVNLIKKLLDICNFDSRRIRIGYSDFNKPKNFINTVNNFGEIIKSLNPIIKNEDNINKLESMYNLTSSNIRIRHLLCTQLRYVEENEYLGSKRDSIIRDEEFYSELKTEFIKSKIIRILVNKNELLSQNDLKKIIKMENIDLGKYLSEMIYDKNINVKYKNHQPFYSV